MKPRAGFLSLILVSCIVSVLWVSIARAGESHGSRPAKPGVVDDSQNIDINNISMVVKNTGSIAFNTIFSAPGLEFPRGSGKFAVFAAGLWLSALRSGTACVSVSEYSDDFSPGDAPGGFPASPANAAFKVYKLLRVYPDVPSRNAALADYTFGAVPSGAPPVVVLGNGDLSIVGDQMLWSVYNDLGKSSSFHNNASTARPVGVEVRQTTWGYNRPGPTGNAVFTSYQFTNRTLDILGDVRISMWVDPDLGGFADDLVGCDQPRGLGFCYNATNADAVYGASPPAIGFDLLRGPTVGAVTLPMNAFTRYLNGTDPQDSLESVALMHGLNSDGSPVINPVTSLQTAFAVSGDPVTNQGWLDSSAGDRRMMLSTGGFSLSPNESKELTYAIVIGQGSDRLDSITKLKLADSAIQSAFDSNTLPLLDAPRPVVARLALASPRPNPARGALTLEFTLPSEGEATLGVVDVAGRHVLTHALGVLPAGTHTRAIEMREAQLAAGVYFVKLAHANGIVSRRVVVLP